MIKGIVNEFNRHRFTYPSNQSVQTAQTNPFLSTNSDTDAAFIPPTESGQNLLSSTLTTHVGKQANSKDDSDSDSDDPSLGDVFTNEKNKPDYKACAIH